jgi:light-independent protochlorophyllide reductase subunit N
MLAYSGSGIETTFTQGEDTCLAGAGARAAGAATSPRCLVVGTLPTSSRTSSAAVRQLGIGPVASCPPAMPPSCRPSAGHPLLLAQPFLGETGAR